MARLRSVSYTHLDVYKRQEVLLVSADESEREWDESLDGQRASFPQVYGETEVSQILY